MYHLQTIQTTSEAGTTPQFSLCSEEIGWASKQTSYVCLVPGLECVCGTLYAVYPFPSVTSLRYLMKHGDSFNLHDMFHVNELCCQQHNLFEQPEVFNVHGSVHYNILIYTGRPRRKGQNFGRVFLMLKYTDITQNTYIQS